MKNIINGLIFAGLTSLFSLSGALHADLTPIQDNVNGEPSLVDNTSVGTSILNTLYGVQNLTRINDSNDQLFSANLGSVKVVATFASNTETLGYFNGSSGPLNSSTFVPLTAIGGSGYNPTGSASNITLNNFQFGLETVGNQGTQYLSSVPANNLLDSPGFTDHVVTFQITGNSGGFSLNPIGSYLIAFEDDIQNSSGLSSDRDFNDNVFLFSNISPIPAPEPSTYFILGGALGLVMLVKQKHTQTA